MNKLFLSTIVLSATFFSTHTASKQNPFEQLTPKIDEMSDHWIDTHVKPFKLPRNQKLLNLLAAENITQQDITDAITAESSISDALEAIGSDMNFFIEIYVENIQKKWFAKKTEGVDEKEFINQLQQKIIELINYTSAIYYEKLHTYMNEYQ